MRTSYLACATLLMVAASASAFDARPTPAPHMIRSMQRRQLFPPFLDPSASDASVAASVSSQESVSRSQSLASESSASVSSVSSASAYSQSIASEASASVASANSRSAAAAASSASSASRSAAQASAESLASVSSASLASLASAQASALANPTTLTQTATVQASETAAAASATNGTSDGGSNHMPLIIGVSVVGGVAVIAVAIFLYMKFGGRRFSDYNEDDADIKWPELKADENSAAMQPLPARRTGGAGFDMGDGSDVGHDDDVHSMQEYGNKGRESFTTSSAALTGAGAYGHGVTPQYDDAGYGAAGGAHAQQGYYDHGYGGGAAAYGAQQAGGQAFYADPQQASHHGASVVGYTDPAYSQDQHAAYSDQDPYAAAGVSHPSDPYARGPSPPQQGAYGAQQPQQMHNPYL